MTGIMEEIFDRVQDYLVKQCQTKNDLSQPCEFEQNLLVDFMAWTGNEHRRRLLANHKKEQSKDISKEDLQEAIEGYSRSLNRLFKEHREDRNRGAMQAALVFALDAVGEGQGTWHEMKAKHFDNRWHGIHEYN